MIKRIVFDVDNTLLEWKDEYIFALKNVLNKLQVAYTEADLKCIDNAIEKYEVSHDIYTIEDFTNFVNTTCHINLPLDFTMMLIEEQGECFVSDQQLVDTISYLSKKYDLMVLSNWFTKTQKMRLEKMGLLKFFSVVSGGDEHPLKPSLEAFSRVLEGINPDECLMVGDSLKHDIDPAVKLGMNVIRVTKEKSDKYQTITNIYELKKLL